MSSLNISNTFTDGTTILATPMNTNFDDIETYINDRNSGSAAWERVLATNGSATPAVFNNSSGTNDSMICLDNGTDAFRVTDGANIVLGTAALATNATNGFLYVDTCAGTPTGTPTTYSGRTPLIWDSTNKLLYLYQGGWFTSQPSVDNSTIEISGGNLRVKDAGITTAKFASSVAISTLDISTALSWKTFNQLKILQVVTATTNSKLSTTNIAYQTTNLSAAITPKINSSKVMVIAHGNLGFGGGSGFAYLTVYRDSTDLASTAGGFALNGVQNNHTNVIIYDSPATTSAVTYSVKIKTNGGGGTASFPEWDAVSLTPDAGMILVEFAI